MADDAPCARGDVLAGRYRIDRLLGEGGMAFVFAGEHLRLKQPVAIKVLRRELWTNGEVVARFEREGRAVVKLKTRHAVRVMDVDTTPEGAPFLVMELLEGCTLQEEIAQRGALPVGEAVHHVVQACTAVSEAHAAGIIHRDLKPANVFLTNDGNERIAKVLDFGISTELVADDARLTKTESVMGTPLYMSPEQLRSTKDVDERADVWALGATLYEALAGRPPFMGSTATVAVAIVNDPLPSLASIRADLPASLLEIVERSLAKDRTKRFSSVLELAAALQPFAGTAPRTARLLVSASTPPIPTAPTQLAMGDQPAAALGATPPNRRRSMIIGAGALVCAAIVAVVISVGRSGDRGATPITVSEPSNATASTTTMTQPPPTPSTSTMPTPEPTPTPTPGILPMPTPSATKTKTKLSAQPSAVKSSAPPTATTSSHPLFFPTEPPK